VCAGRHKTKKILTTVATTQIVKNDGFIKVTALSLFYLVCTTWVPQNNVWRLCVSVWYTSLISASLLGRGVFVTGTLSPVNILSLTMHVPARSRRECLVFE